MMYRSLSVLIVEDFRDGARSLAALIRAAGHKVLIASSDREAEYVAAQTPPDIVFMDIGLPDMDGYEAARRVCAVVPRRPTMVALTGFPWLEERSRQEGFEHHLLKPFEPTALQELLTAAGWELAHVG